MKTLQVLLAIRGPDAHFVETVETSITRRRPGSGRLVAILATFATLLPVQGEADANATINRAQDRFGRVVDITFDRPVDLIAPWDRFRFSVDVVQPLAALSDGFLGDLDRDGVADLVIPSWHGEVLYFPGVAGEPRLFGRGTYLRHTTATAAEDPFQFKGAVWESGDVGDLDRDGSPEVVIGTVIYRVTGTTRPPVLAEAYELQGAGVWDPSASLGDLDGDGDLDVVVTSNYSGGAHVYWNTSQPGTLGFTHLLLREAQPPWQPSNRLRIGDLNGDGLLDLVGGLGIYFNSGTATAPVFDLMAAPTPWVFAGEAGPWNANPESAVGVNPVLADVDVDGDLDVYATGGGETTWQVLLYRNIGTAASPALEFAGPVLTQGSPLCTYHRSQDEPTWNTESEGVAVVSDVDRDGRADITVAGGVVWNRSLGGPFLTYPDLYTWPAHQRITLRCGLTSWSDPVDPVCMPPHYLSAWQDFDGDGRADALLDFSGLTWQRSAFSMLRTGDWPFVLGPASFAVATTGGGTLIAASMAVYDVDGDGRPDVLAGREDGTLAFYRNTATDGGLLLAAPVPLTDGLGAPIDVGDGSCPAPFDLDGDGDLDLLVATASGPVREVMRLASGVGGFVLGGYLDSTDQAPFDLGTTVSGGGFYGPALAPFDADGDGAVDLIGGDWGSRVWLLHNVGTPVAPRFEAGPLIVSQTAAAYLEVLNPTSARLYFGTPLVDDTWLTYWQVPTASGPLTGRVSLDPNAEPEVSVRFGGLEIVDGRSEPIDLGHLTLRGAGCSYDFEVRNVGKAGVVLGPVVPPAGFTLGKGLAATLGPGESDTFTLHLDASSPGVRSGLVSFSTNDGDENPFDFPVTAKVVGPPPSRSLRGRPSAP
jgi:hypothetical protein